MGFLELDNSLPAQLQLTRSYSVSTASRDTCLLLLVHRWDTGTPL